MKYYIKINGIIWQVFDCTEHLKGIECDRARDDILFQTRSTALKMQSEIFEKSDIGIDVTCDDDSGHIYAHGKKTYADDSEVWSRSCNTDDAYRIIKSIIARAILDERGQGPRMNARDIADHNAYMSRSDGLKHDCELVDIDYSALKTKLEADNE